MPQHKTYTGPWDLFVEPYNSEYYFDYINMHGSPEEEYEDLADEPTVRKGKGVRFTEPRDSEYVKDSCKFQSRLRTNRRKANRKTKLTIKETQDV